MAANCPHCGSDVPEGAGFCPRCGKTVATPGDVTRVSGATPPQAPPPGGQPPAPPQAPPPAAPPPAAGPPPAAPPPGAQAPFPPTPAAAQAGVPGAAGQASALAPPPPGVGGRGKLVALLGGGAVLIVVLAILGFVLLGKEDEPPPTPTGGPTTTSPTQPPSGEPTPPSGEPTPPAGEPTPPSGEPGPAPQTGGGSIAENLPRQVGPFTLRAARRVPVLINAGAADAAEAIYTNDGGTRVNFLLAGYESAQTASQHASQLATALTRRGYRVAQRSGGAVRLVSADEVIIAVGQADNGGGIVILCNGPQGVPAQFLSAFAEAVRSQ